MWYRVFRDQGSRGIGNAIASYLIELARKDMERHMNKGVVDEIPGAYKDI